MIINVDGRFFIVDLCGVVFVGLSEGGQTLEAEEALARREDVIAKELKAEKAVSHVMGAGFYQMLHFQEDFV